MTHITGPTPPPRSLAARTPKSDEILDALFALTMACNVGHVRWPEGTRGHEQALATLRNARNVLQRSNRYGLQMREMNPNEEPTK